MHGLLVATAKEMLARLQGELQAARQREASAHEMLAAESRKQRVLQHALQKELASRPSPDRAGSGYSGASDDASGTGAVGGGASDVARTLQRNQVREKGVARVD